MTKRLMLILLVLGGTSFLLISFILPPQQLGSLETKPKVRALEVGLNRNVVKHTRARAESIKKLPNDQPQKTDQQPIRAAIVDIEAELKNAQVLERLNANAIDAGERARLGRKLQHLDYLRTQDLEQQLETIEKEVAELAVTIPSRMKSYGVTQP